MHSLVHNLRSVAQAADLDLRRAGQHPDKLGDCGDQLRKCFSVSLQAPGAEQTVWKAGQTVPCWMGAAGWGQIWQQDARPLAGSVTAVLLGSLRIVPTDNRSTAHPGSLGLPVQSTATTPRAAAGPAGNKEKKLAALDIVNVSIKIYFRLNTLRLCKNLMRTVDSRQFAAFDAFPAAQRVTYKFYVGRLAVFDENYVRLCAAHRRLSARHVHAMQHINCTRFQWLCTWRRCK